MKMMKVLFKYISFTFLGLLTLASCKKQLDEKSSSALQVPSSTADFQALMDNTTRLSQIWPYAGIAGSDETLVSTDSWASTSLTERNAYIWERNVFNDNPRNDWSLSYSAIFYANVVLEGVDQYGQNTSEWKHIKAQAAFFRGYAYYQLAQEFCNAYDTRTAQTDPGLVLRNSSDLNERSVRSTVAQTYERIITDLAASVPSLPLTALVKTRPNKAAAYAMLARTYLSMGVYDKAGAYADSSLQLNSKLMDYKTITSGVGQPFPRFNDEVLFHTISLPINILLPPRLTVDVDLYGSYENGDLRKSLFFKPAAGTDRFSFNGSYDGSVSLFNGPATDEMYLIRAEAAARSGSMTTALADLNTLRKNRYAATSYTPVGGLTQSQALSLILLERRKELLLRGLRWTDLRRLNKEPALAITLKKVINGKTYELPPGDPRYTWPIPQQVINDTGIAQN
jgi:tetratricopeptide (TPR) repeat protein